MFSARGEFDNLDIYISRFENGIWTMPQSISPTINSSEDEDGPISFKRWKDFILLVKKDITHQWDTISTLQHMIMAHGLYLRTWDIL